MKYKVLIIAFILMCSFGYARAEKRYILDWEYENEFIELVSYITIPPNPKDKPEESLLHVKYVKEKETLIDEVMSLEKSSFHERGNQGEEFYTTEELYQLKSENHDVIIDEETRYYLGEILQSYLSIFVDGKQVK